MQMQCSTMLDRLDAALSSLAGTVEGIDARQDLFAYAQQVAISSQSSPSGSSAGSSSSSTSTRPHSPSFLSPPPTAGAGSSPAAQQGSGSGGEEDEAAALKAKITPGIQHMEKCIKTLRAMCRWCVQGGGGWA